MKKRILSILLLLMLVVVPAMAAAAKGAGTGAKGRLLFIPHDNRPISKDETAEVVQKLEIGRASCRERVSSPV